MKDKNAKIQEPIYSSLYLLTLKLRTKDRVLEFFYDYFIELYENNKINIDLVNILDNCKTFGNRIDEILKAIKNKNRIVFNALSLNLKNDLIFSKVSFTSREKFNFRKKILIASQNLKFDSDQDILNNINDLIRILNKETNIINNQKSLISTNSIKEKKINRIVELIVQIEENKKFNEVLDEIHEISKLLFDLEINNDLYDINKGYILDFLMKINTLMLKERIKMTKNGGNAFDLLIK